MNVLVLVRVCAQINKILQFCYTYSILLFKISPYRNVALLKIENNYLLKLKTNL